MENTLPGLDVREFLRIDKERRSVASKPVAIEEPLQILVDGKSVAVLMRTPGDEKELAVGFCISEGLIESFQQIALVQHCGRLGLKDDLISDDLDASRNQVRISTLAQSAWSHDPRLDVLRLVRSGCGRTGPEELADTLSPIRTEIGVPASVVVSMTSKVIEGQWAYRQAGGVHAVAIFDGDGRLVVLGEDIGRHNAIDKALGYCLLRGIRLQDKILYSTGRASYEMVLKAVRLGMAVAISRSSATSLAIDLAERLGCTLVGYARGDKMNVYTHPTRIIQ